MRNSDVAISSKIRSVITSACSILPQTMQISPAPRHTTRQSSRDDLRMGGWNQDLVHQSGVLGEGERDGSTRAHEILNRERLAEFLILEIGFQPAPGAESLAENFFDLRKKPCFLFQPLLLFACFGALCDAPLMCVHLLHAPPKFNCSALDRCPDLSLPKVVEANAGCDGKNYEKA